jgi:hypothetical protein
MMLSNDTMMLGTSKSRGAGAQLLKEEQTVLNDCVISLSVADESNIFKQLNIYKGEVIVLATLLIL